MRIRHEKFMRTSSLQQFKELGQLRSQISGNRAKDKGLQELVLFWEEISGSEVEDRRK